MKKHLIYIFSFGLIFPFLLYAISFGVISQELINKAEKKYGGKVKNRYLAYNDLINKLAHSDKKTQLEEINDFFNYVPYKSDQKNWNKKDYWATPLEFLGKDKGDCEDYVIAKYAALRALGFESKTLFFSYVKSKRFKGGHMVLSYFETPSSIPLILDNTNYKVFPANKRKDLIPIYNFNAESLYLARAQGQQGKKVSKRMKIHKKWDKLVDDIKRNKL